LGRYGETTAAGPGLEAGRRAPERAVPATAGWQTWTTVTLPAGEQTLTIDQGQRHSHIHQLTFA
jgi:hypothetical protein